MTLLLAIYLLVIKMSCPLPYGNKKIHISPEKKLKKPRENLFLLLKQNTNPILKLLSSYQLRVLF